MTSNELKHEAKKQEWSMSIQECMGSGLSVSEWCRQRGVTTATYYMEKNCLQIKGRCLRKTENNVQQIIDINTKHMIVNEKAVFFLVNLAYKGKYSFFF